MRGTEKKVAAPLVSVGGHPGALAPVAAGVGVLGLTLAGQPQQLAQA